MTWTQTHFARSLSPLVASACFFLAISQAAADTITQADADRIANAMVDALLEQSAFSEQLSVITYPINDDMENIGSSLKAGNITVWDLLNSIQMGLFQSQNPENFHSLVSGIRDSVGTSETALASVLDTLQNIQGDTSTYLHYLSPIDSSVMAIDTYLNTDYRWTSQSATALRVHDEELLDAILDLRTENDSNIYDVTSGIGQFQGDVSNALASLSLDVSDVVDTLEDGGSLSGLGSGIDPSTELGLADTNSLTAPPVVGISTSNLQADLTTMNLTGGDSVITFWESTDIGGWTVPAASLDLASPRMSRAVSRMRDISVTLWWLAFFTAVYLLCRREITYYASLAHTEGN